MIWVLSFGKQEQTTSTVMQLESLAGQMVAVVAPSSEDGQRYAVVSVAVAEAFPTGALHVIDTTIIWGTCSHCNL